MGTLAKAFYLRLAVGNVRRGRKTFLPYILATAVISGVFLLIGGLLFSEGLTNVPSGATAATIFAFGLVVFAIFAFCFMAYINNFLIGRRKKEFGLYGVLGLNRRHIGRVLIWENAITLGLGVLLGVVLALVFGRLLFLLLLKLIRAVPNSRFALSPNAFLITGLLFFAVFACTSLFNLRQVRISSPMELMRSQRKGEKDSKLIWPLAVAGALALAAAYYYAWTIDNPGVAIGVFFLLVILVIFGTHTLFSAGSIVTLRLLRQSKRIYYRPRNFIAIGGMFQRMRQNARSLATICILSTMLVVTVSGTLALYLGQEEMLTAMYPYDVSIWMKDGHAPEALRQFDRDLVSLAADYNVTLSADKSKLIYGGPVESTFARNNYVYDYAEWIDMPNLVYFDGGMRFDVEGEQADCLAFMDGVRKLYWAGFPDAESFSVGDVFEAREDGYGVYGGLLFLGAFFGVLFLAVTVLIIYFKQITEGYEDKAQFEILQKVGMDDAQVRQTINAQVLWVFFIPLGMTMLHMVFASRIMTRMLRTFELSDWGMVLGCIGGVCLAFALLYLFVYRLTAKLYYRIVRR